MTKDTSSTNNEIRKVGDPGLRVQATPVLQAENIEELILSMIKACVAAGGLGLAANQIGSNKAVFILNMDAKGEKFEAYRNPVILEASEEVEIEEGCLSIPGVVATTKRYNKVRLTFVDDEGSLREETAEGLKAIAIQHEVDHLSGKLY